MNISTTTIVPNTTTSPYAPVLPSNDKCNYYIVNQTSIAWLDFGNPYGGIPQNLLINSVSNFVISHSILLLAYQLSYQPCTSDKYQQYWISDWVRRPAVTVCHIPTNCW